MKADQNGHGSGHGGAQLNAERSLQQSIDANHEVSGIELRGIIVFLVGLTVMTVVVYVLMLLLFNLLSANERTTEKPRSKLALSEKERLPVEPRLQSAPGFAEKLGQEVGAPAGHAAHEADQPKDRTWELVQLRTMWEDELEHGAKDESGQRIGISIKAAKEEFLSGSQKLENQTVDYAVEMPTAASSGRMTEKRKQ